MMLWFLLRDEGRLGGWQSGFFTVGRRRRSRRTTRSAACHTRTRGDTDIATGAGPNPRPRCARGRGAGPDRRRHPGRRAVLAHARRSCRGGAAACEHRRARLHRPRRARARRSTRRSSPGSSTTAETPVLWGVLWRVETDWLPFLTLVTVLVFSQAGLYEERERRPGLRRVILSSLLLVALITLAFAIGTGHHFSTYGLAPTAVLLCAVTIAGPARELRASSPARCCGTWARAATRCSPARARTSRTCTARSAPAAAGSTTSSSARSRLRPKGVGLPVLGDVQDLPAVLEPRARGRADRDRLGLRRARAARDRRPRPPARRPGADRAEERPSC